MLGDVHLHPRSLRPAEQGQTIRLVVRRGLFGAADAGYRDAFAFAVAHLRSHGGSSRHFITAKQLSRINRRLFPSTDDLMQAQRFADIKSFK